MSATVREILGIVTLVAIFWDTVMTAILLHICIGNKRRITKLEKIQRIGTQESDNK